MQQGLESCHQGHEQRGSFTLAQGLEFACELLRQEDRLIGTPECLNGWPGPIHRQLQRWRGADELTLVNSGLEETMAAAYREIRAVRETHKAIPDLRTAAFLVAIQKVGRSYHELGIFP